ncbi:MAG: hypothetical protein IKO68_01135 [Oscillospiraceae bacterium]|nr:hypothetical protein [Oscillospiraceae bacterium]
MELTFEQFCHGEFCVDPFSHEDKILWLHEADMDIGGGRISIPEIDVLAEHPEAEAVRITGLRQDTFEYFIKTYGRRLKAIEFFKNKLVEDWSLLGTLPELEYVYWFANQRIDRLWDMRGNTSLKGLCVSDFTRLHSIEGIQAAPALRYFCFKDAVWDSSEVESFSPLAHTGVTHLMFGAKRITDGSLEFLEKMPSLELFDFPLNQFTTEQAAWAVANFPNLNGYGLCAKRDDTVYKSGPNGEHLELPGAYIVGKRKPALSYEKDAARIQRYMDQFEALKEKYRGVPYIELFG